MPAKVTGVRLEDPLLDALRRATGLPADAPNAQVIRAALLRFLGQPNADGAGRPGGKHYQPRKSAANP